MTALWATDDVIDIDEIYTRSIILLVRADLEIEARPEFHSLRLMV